MLGKGQGSTSYQFFWDVLHYYEVAHTTFCALVGTLLQKLPTPSEEQEAQKTSHGLCMVVGSMQGDSCPLREQNQAISQ